MVTPEFVKYIGEGKSGLNYGDVVKVLTEGVVPDWLYVECPQKSHYVGDAATHPSELKDKNFTFLNAEEYELIKEKKEMKNTNKFKVGDIICGKDCTPYSHTNKDMTKGKVTAIKEGGIEVKILEHKNSSYVGQSYWVDPDFFDLVTDPLYNITTDMVTFVEVVHGTNKAKSKCNVECDKFDLHTGIDIAMGKLNEIENPEPLKYVKYIGNETGGLKKGDICKVLSAGGEHCIKGNLFVASPLQGIGFVRDAQNPEAVKGHTFTYLWSSEYEPVTVHE